MTTHTFLPTQLSRQHTIPGNYSNMPNPFLNLTSINPFPPQKLEEKNVKSCCNRNKDWDLFLFFFLMFSQQFFNEQNFKKSKSFHHKVFSTSDISQRLLRLTIKLPQSDYLSLVFGPLRKLLFELPSTLDHVTIPSFIFIVELN